MSNPNYNLITLGDNPLRTDKNLLEIQKTIIYYGESNRLEIDKLATLVRTLVQRDKDKGKGIVQTFTSKDNYYEKSQKFLLQYLENLDIPKGYSLSQF